MCMYAPYDNYDAMCDLHVLCVFRNIVSKLVNDYELCTLPRGTVPRLDVVYVYMNLCYKK